MHIFGSICTGTVQQAEANTHSASPAENLLEIMASVLALRTFASLTLSRVTRNPRLFHNSPAGMILLLSLSYWFY